MRLFIGGITALAVVLGLAATGQAQEKTTLSITRQPGILYLASHVMETQKLIEKQAAAEGLSDTKVEWRTFSGGGAQTDALLAGNVDVVNTGTGNLLLLWDRTRGRVKGIITSSAQPVIMVSNDPRIKTLADIQPTDKIAVPTVGVSTQAILLQIAAAKMFGDDQVKKFDPNTVQLGHPDAVAAIANPSHEVKSHFSAPPFQYLELKQQGVHKVTDSREILGGGLTQATFFTTTQFAEANPKLVKALRTATEEAVAFIKKDPKTALEAYKSVSGDKTSLDDLMAMLKEPGMDEWRTDPQGTMKFAEHLHKVGVLKTMPAAWTDYYLPDSAYLNGN
ncbi:ABC transporter substrate-binding protein [Agrobacterium rubi]|uniref:ABC transporter substrate-binding protein n=2 Tax=Agrobacterium rubi TaxID=28099 RepID=A0AAE7US09_9HYPH|nr:ABC transporter substrate-binding protein [Agrobacterium rubi]MBP1880351.1 NitT/TauT family transport system substrate-binding protein [Agrobacterium rubi]MCL6654644.1 ABC transporter substrate-binding protein [Agrobacterium rubi]NTE88001.1 ABC transporter substrate-binding protein [Agrobacterium rubi]NTF03768.1 ABC transporter substrate-binding protein [Agrobacterium rubi]NTF38095.1 ABC transporter substrate-binding protein [Agrobacterium rubi]